MNKTATGLVLSIALVAATAHAADLKNVGITLGSMGNPFFVSLANAANKQADQINPKVQVVSVGADYDLGKQFNQIENFIASDVDIILLNASDPVAIAPAVKKATAAGIPVIAVGDRALGSNAVVMTDNNQAARLSCQFLADKIGDKGNVIIINGPQVSSVVERVKGCKAVFSKYPAIKLLSSNEDAKGSRDGGLDVAEALLTRYPHIDGIFTINDPTAIGADLAAKQLHRSEMIITSVDGSPDIVAALKSDTLIQASAAQEPRTMGIEGIKIGWAIINGKKLTNSTVLIPSKLVTRANVGSYAGW
ncbi:ABC transporter substrate-binding protein [Acidisoma sp. S159]|jgi:ribose transport system substrate-binding protein|uniref:ABC transporter substrate-binding protein n=1 Tax=Acidisoma sp. S159 TaxID=1747225 RepID=UPI00131D680C|nr:ABC transporter substrate-binding protein [Acidisoma sp. S159]